MSAGLTLVVLVALLGFWAVGAYNRLVRLRGALVVAWAPVDAELRRRQALAADLGDRLGSRPVMNDTVGRMTLATLQAATRQARAATDLALARPSRAGAIQSLGLAEQVLEGSLEPVKVLMSARREILEHGDEDALPVQPLLDALADNAAQLAYARRLFNDAVRAYNGAVHELPTTLIAAIFGFKPAATLQAATPERGPDSQIASAYEERGG